MVEIKAYPSSRKINLLHPTPDQIRIRDIAHHLSLLPRYLGGTRKPYSNAQHSWFISYAAGPGGELAGLLHDAAEAYTGDLPSPLKHLPEMAFYRDVQYNLTNMIMKKFGVDWNAYTEKWVHDREKDFYPWEEFITGRNIRPDWDEFPKVDYLWSASHAERMFMQRFTQLYRGPNGD
jgi:hypothetical protein